MIACSDPCADGECIFTRDEWTRLQSLAELPDPPPDPSNKYAEDPLAAALGQKLYFDEAFSGDATQLDMLRRPTAFARAPKGTPAKVSCATCHDPARGGADVTSTPGHVSVGAGWYDVNGQQTYNAAYWTLMYWNGRNDSVWSQILAVSESFVSMASSRLQIAWRLHDVYGAEYAAVFPEYPLVMDPVRFPAHGRPGTEPGCQAGSATEPFGDAFDCMTVEDQETVTRAFVNFAKAIAAYEQRLVSRDSAFDRFVAAGPKSGVISAAAQRGAKLFVGKASCIDCHSGPLLSDNAFHNVGVPQVGEAVPTVGDCPSGGVCDCVEGKNCLPWGAFDGLTKLGANPFRRTGQWSDDPNDTSREGYYGPPAEELKGAWRTPSLRDVEITAPYMHDGVYETLDEVVWHYTIGGLQSGIGTKAAQIVPLGLTAGEQADLVEFLRTLTGAPLEQALVTKP